jgi:hypothetical protein
MPDPLRPPAYVRRFRDALLSVAPAHIEFAESKPPIRGHRGILHTSRLQYNDSPWNHLGREHEYTFAIGDARLEVSLHAALDEPDTAASDGWRVRSHATPDDHRA